MTSRVNGEGSEAEAALLSAFVFLHRQKQKKSATGAPNARHARVLDHFQNRARRLVEERAVTEEAIARVFEAGQQLPARPPQQELQLFGAPGATAAGRIRIRNRSAQPAHFELCVGEAVEGNAQPNIECEPARGTLGPGATQLVRIAADLRDFSAGERVTLPVECRWRLGRDCLWLVVTAEATEPEAR